MATDTRVEPRAGGLRVLVLDNDPDTADSVGQLLLLWGHEPRVAYNGAQALELARVHRPDVALLDLSLPRLNGYDVAVQLRRQPESRDAVLIAITGHAELQARRRASACGFARFLVKPVEPDALETLLTELRDRLLGATSKRRKSKATGRMVLPRPSDPPRARG